MPLTADLSGKRALITGASSGLGAHFAAVLANAGAKVVLAARRTEQLQLVAGSIAATGGEVEVVAMNVADRQSILAALTTVGSVDILVNNAGVTNIKPIFDQTEADWDFILNTNLKGAWMVALETARRMRATGGGSIINIASVLGLRQAGQVSLYAVSKAGMLQLTKQLALELARFEIRVNALAPGYFATELNAEFFARDEGKRLIARVPQRRLGRLEDLDGPLLLLASEASAFMTGAVIAVDGGHLVASL